MKRVLIIQAQMMQYRVPFFIQLNGMLREDGICLRVAYSDPPNENGRNDNCELPPALGSKVPGHWKLGGRVLYQPLLREVAAADLVIAQEANKHLLNYLLVALSMLGAKRVALWGFGDNKDENRSEFSEWVRRKIVSKVDGYFAYTHGAARHLASNGARPETITTVGNAIDTRKFAELLDRISEPQLSLKKCELGIEENARIGLFCGALSPDKGLGFLLDAAQTIRAQLPHFHLIIVGGGKEQEIVRSAIDKWPWIHYVGPQFGEQKAMSFKLADVFLLPGRVGLAILDAFAAGLPLLTTDVPYHGPEIEYLEHLRNGLLTESNVEAYASEVVSLLSKPMLLHELKEGALASARKYSIDAMVSNFRAGVLTCLGSSGEKLRAVTHGSSVL